MYLMYTVTYTLCLQLIVLSYSLNCCFCEVLLLHPASILLGIALPQSKIFISVWINGQISWLGWAVSLQICSWQALRTWDLRPLIICWVIKASYPLLSLVDYPINAVTAFGQRVGVELQSRSPACCCSLQQINCATFIKGLIKSWSMPGSLRSTLSSHDYKYMCSWQLRTCFSRM